MQQWQPGLLDARAVKGGWALAALDGRFLADSNGVLFPLHWLRQQELPVRAEHGLGHYQGQPLVVLELQYPADIAGAQWLTLRQLMMQSEPTTFKLLGYASQIITWAREHRFCGACGQPLQHLAGERAMHCEPCGLRLYPKLSPSIIVLINRGEEILLARSPHFAPGYYSTLAGFVEPGESLEECVHREVFEEVGVRIAAPVYQGSQNWPFPHSLMLGFHAEYVSGDIVPQEGEIEDAQWFHCDRLPSLPPAQAISRYLIDLYLARRSGGREPVLPG